MPCSNKSPRHNCVQGRQPCPTPWECGGFSADAAWDVSTHRVIHITPAEPEPADKPIVDIVPKWLVLMAIGALLAVIFWALPRLS